MSYLDTIKSITRAALYHRVSTDAQAEKFSLPAQDKLTRELAAKYGWQIVEVYRDEGFSGSWIERRPAFSALLADAARRRFEAVLVTDFDRLTRPENLTDMGRIQQVFIENDVKIVTLGDVLDLRNNDQWFLSSLMGLVGTNEKKKMIVRMKRGIEAKKEQGRFVGGIPPSGYERQGGALVLRESRGACVGKKKATSYSIYDWRTVREAFDLYLYKERSLASIAGTLGMQTGQVCELLDRAWFYAGWMTRTRTKEERRDARHRAGEKTVKGLHPAIVSDVESERTLARRAAGLVAYRKTRAAFSSAGLVKCATCAEPMYVQQLVRAGGRRRYFYFVCKGNHGAARWQAKQKGLTLKRCAAPWIRADQVEAALWRLLTGALAAPEFVMSQIEDSDHQGALAERDIEACDRHLAELARRRNNLIDLYADGRFPIKELDERVRTLDAAEAKQRAAKARAEVRMAEHRRRKVAPEAISRILYQVTQLVRCATEDQRREIVRLLCREITIKPGRRIEVIAALPDEHDMQRLSGEVEGDVQGAAARVSNRTQRVGVADVLIHTHALLIRLETTLDAHPC